MIRRILALTLVWVALWGDPSPANFLWGAIIAVILSVVFPERRVSGARFHPLAVARLTGYMFFSLVTSTWSVVLAVVRPTPDRIEHGVLTVPLATRSTLVAAVVSNSITLTPGTMTLSCDPDTFVLSVHVLGRVDPPTFVARIQHLEGMVAKALGASTAGKESA
jgi:multicomponent Na+:H+ antiporter subunit E